MNIVSVENTAVASDASCHKIANVNGLNLFMSNGKAWHGLGMEVDSNFVLSDIKETFPQLIYEIEHRPCFAQVGGENVRIDGVNAIIFKNEGFEKFFEARSATDDRPIIQPVETLNLLEDTFKEFGAKFSSVGSLYDGETFFVSAELPVGFEVCGDDHLSYLNVVDNFTGMAGYQMFSSDFRVVCRNTAKAAWLASDKRFQLNHTGEMASRIEQLALGFREIVAQRPKAIELLRNAAKYAINPSVAINRVLDAVFGAPGLNINVSAIEMADVRMAAVNRAIELKTSEIDKVEKLIVKQVNKRNGVFDKIMSNYESKTCETARGTAYSAYQAITEYANYGIESKKTARQAGNDFLSLATGKGATLTDAAWNALIVAC